jgi:hypothetical protein
MLDPFLPVDDLSVAIAFNQFRITKHPFQVSTENIGGRRNSRRQGNRARLLCPNRAPNKKRSEQPGRWLKRRAPGYELCACMSACGSAAAYKLNGHTSVL